MSHSIRAPLVSTTAPQHAPTITTTPLSPQQLCQNHLPSSFCNQPFSNTSLMSASTDLSSASRHSVPCESPSSSSALSPTLSSLPAPQESKQRSRGHTRTTELPYKVLSVLRALSFPRLDENFQDFHALHLLFQLCLFRHELLQKSWELMLTGGYLPFLDAGMMDRIRTYAADLSSLQRKIDGATDNRIATLSGGFGVYDSMLTFELFATKLLELLTYLNACGFFDTPDDAWPELAAFVYRCRARGWDLGLLGHRIVAEFVQPEMVSFLAMVDRYITVVVARDPTADPFIPLSIEQGIVDLKNNVEEDGPYAIRLLGEARRTVLIPDTQCTLCGEHLSTLLQTLVILGGSNRFGLLPLRGFVKSQGDGMLHIVFEPPWEADSYHISTLKEALGDPAQRPAISVRHQLAIDVAKLVHAWDTINFPSGPLWPEDILLLTKPNSKVMQPFLRNFNRFRGCGGESCAVSAGGMSKRDDIGSRARWLHEQEIESLGFLLVQIFEWRDLQSIGSLHKSLLFHMENYNGYAYAALNAISGRGSERWADREAKVGDIFPANGFGRLILCPLLLPSGQVVPTDAMDLPIEDMVRHIAHALSVQPYGMFGSLDPLLRDRWQSFRLENFRPLHQGSEHLQIDSAALPLLPGQPPTKDAQNATISPWPARKSSLAPGRHITKTQAKRRVFPVKPDPEVLDCWHTRLLPRLEKLIKRIPPVHKPTSLSVDLLGVGATRESSRPTIVVTCDPTSAPFVGEFLKQKLLYDPEVFDFKIRKGSLRRTAAHRNSNPVQNNWHINYQPKPVSGASIGAVRDGIDLPPGTFGGVVEIDGKVYGMTVHHLLDPLSAEDIISLAGNGVDSDVDFEPLMKVNDDANSGEDHDISSDIESWEVEEFPAADVPDSDAEDGFAWESDSSDGSFGDYDMGDISEVSSIVSTESSISDSGDIPGLDLNHNIDININQPCRYDSPAAATLFGRVASSSGLRRARASNVVHELDWALLEILPSRQQNFNIIPGGGRFVSSRAPVDDKNFSDVLPIDILPASDLGDRHVHSNARTSGLQVGFIGPAMSALVLPGRRSAARSWCVIGNLGDSGDSGAWVIDNSLGKVAGVVIASHGAGRGDMQAYISPMEVIMDDVKAVMGADHVRLPACSPGIIKNVQKNAGKSVDVIADLETKVERTMSQEKGNCELGNPRKVDVISWSMAIKEVKKVEVEVRDELFCV